MTPDPKSDARPRTYRTGFLVSAGLCALLLGLLVARPLIGGIAGDTAKDQVRAVLDAQKKAWNAGDLDKFMATYWMSDDLTFYSDAEAKGWVNLHERYEKKYRKGQATMGELDFPQLHVDVLAADAAVVRGKWKLTRDGTTTGGFFTLIVRKQPDGWKIVHDHTSVEKTP